MINSRYTLCRIPISSWKNDRLTRWNETIFDINHISSSSTGNTIEDTSSRRL